MDDATRTSSPRWPRVRTPDPTLGRSSRPEMKPVSVERVPGAPAHAKADVDPPTKPKRQRIVLDDGPVAPVRPYLHSRSELAQQTSWGATLIADQIHGLLKIGVLFALLTVAVVGGLPLVMWLLPDFARLEVVGVPLAWLLLGVAPFSVLGGIGLLFVRVTERHERAFVDMIEHRG